MEKFERVDPSNPQKSKDLRKSGRVGSWHSFNCSFSAISFLAVSTFPVNTLIFRSPFIFHLCSIVDLISSLFRRYRLSHLHHHQVIYLCKVFCFHFSSV